MSTGRHASNKEAVEFEIRSWPLLSEGWRGPVFLAITLTAAWSATRISQSWGMGILTWCAMLAVSQPFWGPVRYQFSPAGITEYQWLRKRRIPWPSIRHWKEGRHGLVYYLAPPDSLLAGFSTVFVPWRGQREELLRMTKHYLRERRDAGYGSSPQRQISPPGG